MRKTAAMCVVAAILGHAHTARTDDKVACVAAAEAAQQHRSAGKLRRARMALRTCVREACPAIVRTDCTQWLAEVEGGLPTIVVRAQDSRGRDLTDVRVELDSELLAEKLEGLPLEVDPGRHVLTYTRKGSPTRSQEILIHTGERNRTVSVVLDAIEPAGDPPSSGGGRVALASAGSFRPPAATWIFAGVGVLAAGSFAYFGLQGLSQKADMERDCKPNCPQSRVDAAYRELLVADISLATAVVATGVATYLFLSSHEPRSTSQPAREMTLTPLSGGAAALWVERF